MSNRTWYYLGCIALGAVGATLFIKNREKMKPMAAQLVAKGLKVKEKALDYAARTKEHAEDVVAEAKHINETSAQG